MRVRPLCVGLAVVLFLVHAPYSGRVTADSVLYHIENLGSLGAESFARAINASGVVAGYGALVDGSLRGFVAAPGAPLQALETLGGPGGQAFGVNDAGVTAGFAASADGYTHAFRATPGAFPQDLGTLGGLNSFGYGVNEAGMVAGYSVTVTDDIHAFRFTDAAGLEDLGTLGGAASFAWDVNASGTVAGQSYLADGTAHGFVWTNGTMTDVGTLGGNYSNAAAINDAGVAVGSAAVGSGTWHAFRKLSGAAMEDLGTLGGAWSGAEGVNGHGDVVGWSYTSSGEMHAFRWTAADGLVDLNTLVDPAEGWTLVAAYAVNDAGQVAGYGYVGGEVRAFRLSPPQAPSDATPPSIASVSATPAVLESPNHRLVAVGVSVVATDDSGDAPACTVSHVTSNEPDNGLGDGDTAGDIVQDGPLALELRAERSAQGSGRVYTVTVTCTDAAGNVASATTSVGVPKNSSSDSAQPSGKKPKGTPTPVARG